MWEKNRGRVVVEFLDFAGGLSVDMSGGNGSQVNLRKESRQDMVMDKVKSFGYQLLNMKRYLVEQKKERILFQESLWGCFVCSLS